MKKIAFSFLAFFILPAIAIADEVYDPLENVNRGIFWFNNKLDIYILQPVADGYNWAVPDMAQSGVRNFFKNLRFPLDLVNDILLLDGKNAAKHTGRFFINTVFGFVGLVDIAKMKGLTAESQDLGTTLGRYGVGEGPYLVLPFLGASNLRDFFGMAGDTAMHPFAYQYYINGGDENALSNISFGLAALDNLQLRVDLDEAIKDSRKASLDHYIFVRKAYQQAREGKIKNKTSTKSEDESLEEMLEEEESNF